MSPAALLFYFLKLGTTGFGGPLALLAQMQKDLIDHRKIMSQEEYLKSLALIKSLPGPIAIQMVAFITYKLYGPLWAVAASVLFVLPAAVMMLLLAIFHNEFRNIQVFQYFLDGMQGGAFFLILLGLYSLTKSYQKEIKFWILFVLSVLLVGPFKIIEPFVILIVGSVSNVQMSFKNRLQSFLMLDILWVCLKAGGLAFGTGLAIIPLLQTDFVDLHHWVTREQFMDALAFGQMTPGPISVTVTFVGYKVAGFSGALIATFGIFFPGVFNMTTWFPRAFTWFSTQKWIQRFVFGATAAIAAGIIIALVQMFETISWQVLVAPIAIFAFSLKWKLPSWVMVIGSGMSWVLLKSF